MFRQFSRRLRLTKLPFPDPYNPPPSNFYIRCSKIKPNLTFPLTRSLHISLPNRDKIFTDTENSYAYTILPPIPKLSPTWSLSNPIKTPEEFTQFLDRNWRGCRAPEIVEAFERVKDFCVANRIDLSDRRFDKLVDGLMDHCEKLTDDELLRLLVLLTEYPPCESSTSRNFHDIWSCLDDVCCWKMGAWEYEKMFNFAEIWYKLNLGRFSDFLSEVLDKATNKAHQLSKELVLYTFFYLNVARRKSVPFEFEHSVANVIQQLTLEELTIVAMGYFKTKTKVKEKPILDAMIKAINENCDSINEISLSAMFKTIRLSQHHDTVDQIPPLLDNLTPQIPRFSQLANLHIALLGTSLQIKHENSLKACAQRTVNDIENVRIKDIERMLLACAMFNLDTDPSIYQLAFKEIHKSTRTKEFIQYSRCLVSTLHYLSLRQIYSYEFLNKVLDNEYITEVYGKHIRNVPRELFSLDCCIEIDCPNYTGNRLEPKIKYKSVKWLSEYTPSRDQPKRLSTSDKYYLDIVDHVTVVVGEGNVTSYHVLPHFSKPDIVVCRDKSSGRFVEPRLDDYQLGDVMRPRGDNFDWFAFMVLTPNSTVRGRTEPLGAMIMKERQLKAVGFKPVMVFWNEFSSMATSKDKCKFIYEQLRT